MGIAHDVGCYPGWNFFFNGGCVQGTHVVASAPWWTFPRIDNYGAPDPFGGFPKPDSNIQVPANYPVVALLPGTVTCVNSPGGGIPDWGAGVTLRLDKPYNSLATHTAYIHLARVTVSVGQHVNKGDLIGYNGSANAAGGQKVPLGFALYAGDCYGYDSWMPGNPLLNMTPLLDAAAKGQNVGGVTGTPVSATGNPFTDWITGLFGTGTVIGDWILKPARIAKLVVGMVLIGIAVFALVSPEAEKYAKQAAKLAAFA